MRCTNYTDKNIKDVGTYPISYQKAILPEDLTCSSKNTLENIKIF